MSLQHALHYAPSESTAPLPYPALPHTIPGPAPCHTRPCLMPYLALFQSVVSWLGAGRDDNDYWTAEVIEEGEWFAGLESLSL